MLFSTFKAERQKTVIEVLSGELKHQNLNYFLWHSEKNAIASITKLKQILHPMRPAYYDTASDSHTVVTEIAFLGNLF